MIDDLIRRSDAIEAIEVVDWYHQNRNKDMVSGANSDEHQAWYKADDIYEALEAVPSADRKTEPTISKMEQVEDKFKLFDREDLILLIECQKERIAELLTDKDTPQTDCDHRCVQTEVGCERTDCAWK